MTYEQSKNLKETEFKRLCGVKPQIFEEMVSTLKQELPTSIKRGGQPKLSIEDQLLITLEYWREYRTYFQQLDWVCWGFPSAPLVHIVQSWRVHESTVCRIVHRVEEQLIKSRKFSLPGKKVLSSTEREK